MYETVEARKASRYFWIGMKCDLAGISSLTLIALVMVLNVTDRISDDTALWMIVMLINVAVPLGLASWIMTRLAYKHIAREKAARQERRPES